MDTPPSNGLQTDSGQRHVEPKSVEEEGVGDAEEVDQCQLLKPCDGKQQVRYLQDMKDTIFMRCNSSQWILEMSTNFEGSSYNLLLVWQTLGCEPTCAARIHFDINVRALKL